MQHNSPDDNLFHNCSKTESFLENIFTAQPRPLFVSIWQHLLGHYLVDVDTLDLSGSQSKVRLFFFFLNPFFVCVCPANLPHYVTEKLSQSATAVLACSNSINEAFLYCGFYDTCCWISWPNNSVFVSSDKTIFLLTVWKSLRFLLANSQQAVMCLLDRSGFPPGYSYYKGLMGRALTSNQLLKASWG